MQLGQSCCRCYQVELVKLLTYSCPLHQLCCVSLVTISLAARRVLNCTTVSRTLAIRQPLMLYELEISTCCVISRILLWNQAADGPAGLPCMLDWCQVDCSVCSTCSRAQPVQAFRSPSKQCWLSVSFGLHRRHVQSSCTDGSWCCA